MSAASVRCLVVWLLLLFVAQQAAAERVVGMSKRVYDHIAEVQELFDKDEWIWLYKNFGYTGDYEFIYF